MVSERSLVILSNLVTRVAHFLAAWKVGEPPTDHAPRSADLAFWLGCVVGQRGHAAPHAVGRVSTEPTLRYVRRMASERSLFPLSNLVARVACVLATWKVGEPPTEHAPRSADLAFWRGCVVGQRGARSSPCRRQGLDRTNTATGRRYGMQAILVASFESRGARRARSSPREKSANRLRSTLRKERGLGVVVLWTNAGRAPPHAVDLARPHQN